MRIHILLEFQEGPWGGGNHFLKLLRRYLIAKGIWEERPEAGDVILFNSHQELKKVLRVKCACRDSLFIHRIDGPISVFRKTHPIIDLVIYNVNQSVADGTVFQSDWSRAENYKMGLVTNQFEAKIMNAPDPDLFNKQGKPPFDKNRKIRLINTSWSPSWNKGFHVLRWLDRRLDFSKYEMTFIGRSPISFRNIRWIQPLPNQDLAEHLKGHDIFITASRHEACSNSLLEAMHCGLPSIGVHGGSTPEIIQGGGELFRVPDEIPGLLDKVVENYEAYQKAIRLPGIDEVGKKYVDFISDVLHRKTEKQYHAKKVSCFKKMDIMGHIYRWQIMTKLDRLKEMVGVRQTGDFAES